MEDQNHRIDVSFFNLLFSDLVLKTLDMSCLNRFTEPNFKSGYVDIYDVDSSGMCFLRNFMEKIQENYS